MLDMTLEKAMAFAAGATGWTELKYRHVSAYKLLKARNIEPIFKDGQPGPIKNDFMAVTQAWFGLWAPTPENLGTDICKTFHCTVRVEPEPSVAMRIQKAEQLLLDLHDQAYVAFEQGNVELEQALDDRAGVLRAQIARWQKAAGMANVLVEDDSCTKT